MDFRLANICDLTELKVMYQKIIDHMNRSGISIWDEVYPCEFFREDMERNRLHVLVGENHTIAAAYALYESNAGNRSIQWKNAADSAFYVNYLGVNVDFLRRGIGSEALKNAAALTRQKGVGSLRLFVVDINKPAINLYLKNGFLQAAGIYEEKIDEGLTLREYGMEMDVSK